MPSQQMIYNRHTVALDVYITDVYYLSRAQADHRAAPLNILERIFAAPPHIGTIWRLKAAILMRMPVN